MYYDLDFDKRIYLYPEEIDYFTKDLPYICEVILKKYRENTKESLFDLLEEEIRVNRHTDFTIWLRKYRLFLVYLLYIYRYALVEVVPLKLKEV